MADIFRRLVWFFIVASVIAYGTFLLAGSAIAADASNKYDPIVVRDKVRPNVHALSGMVMVPSTCRELTVKVEPREDHHYALLFTTWEEPSIACAKEETPRSFHVIVFAPAAGVHFEALLDGVPLPMAVYPTTE